MKRKDEQALAIVNAGKSAGLCRVLSSGGGSLELAGLDGDARRFCAAREKVFFLSREALTTEDLRRARAEAQEMAYGELWRASGGAPATIDELAGRLISGLRGDRLRLLVVCAYFRERPLFPRVSGETLTPAEESLAEKIIASKEADLLRASQQAALQVRIENGDLSMVDDGNVDEVLFGKGSALGRTIDRHCAQAGIAKPELLLRHAKIASELDYHRRWIRHNFSLREPSRFRLREAGNIQTNAGARPVSLDHEGTSEIDDALTVKHVRGEELSVSAHICAPIFRIGRGDILDAHAMDRLSTIYMPGEKMTMLPLAAYREMSLFEGTDRTVVTLDVRLSLADGTCSVSAPRLENVRIARNSFFRSVADVGNLADLGFADEAAARKTLAVLRARRNAGKVPPRRRRTIHPGPGDSVQVAVEDAGMAEEIVSEMMILANSALAGMAHEHRIPLIYRSRGSSSMSPGADKEQGGAPYAWFTSPLRRYVDLVNQRQISSLLSGEPGLPLMKRRELAPIAKDFDRRYAKIMQVQRFMEKYWVLKYLLLHKEKIWEGEMDEDAYVEIVALGVRGKLAGAPPAGTKVLVRIKEADLYQLSARFAEVS